MALSAFTPQVRDWFARAFAAPTPAQAQAWPAIATGEHTLISAPTGSGKTLAAFLWALDRLVAEPSRRPHAARLRLAAEGALLRRREEPARAAARASPAGHVKVAIRTGDTPQRDRRDMVRHPPDVLITTPESLYLMLTSQAREIFSETEWVIVDEIHAVAQTKRGAHLAVTLERLAEQAGRDVQRIGLSATQNPLEEVGRFMVGPQRKCTIVDTGVRKPLDLKIHVPVESMVEPDEPRDARARPVRGGQEATRKSIWPAIYPELLELVREHRSTLVFVNNRRGAERLALRLNELAREDEEAGAPTASWRAHHGSLAREERLLVEDQLKAGELPCLVATSSLELGIDMGAIDLVLQVESPKSVTAGLQRIGRAGHNVGETSKGRIFPKFRADLLECAVVAQRMREGLIETTVVPRNPLDVLAQQIVAMAAAAGDDGLAVDALHALAHAAPTPTPSSPAPSSRTCSTCSTAAIPSEEFGELRPRIVWDRVAGTPARPPRRPRARGHQRRHDPRPRPVLGQPAGRPARRRARRGDGLRGAARPGVPARRDELADRGHHARPRGRLARARRARRGPVLEGRRRSAARRELGAAIGAFARWAVEQDPETLEREYDLDERAAAQPRRLPARAAGRHARRAERPHGRRRALPRRDRRLAPVRPVALRRPRPRGLGPRAVARRSAMSTASRPTRSGPTTGSSSTSPTPTSRRAPTSC